MTRCVSGQDHKIFVELDGNRHEITSAIHIEWHEDLTKFVGQQGRVVGDICFYISDDPAIAYIKDAPYNKGTITIIGGDLKVSIEGVRLVECVGSIDVDDIIAKGDIYWTACSVTNTRLEETSE